MWESGFSVSVGCLLMYVLWSAVIGFIGIGWLAHDAEVQNIGLGLAALAASLTVMRDNQRTRRMLRRPGENLRPMR
jgi:hypothetical protein